MKKSQVVKQKKLHNLALEKALLTHRRRYLPFWVCACICVCRLKFGTYYFVTSFFLAFFQSKLFFNSITGYGYILFEFKMIKPYCWDFSIFPFFFYHCTCSHCYPRSCVLLHSLQESWEWRNLPFSNIQTAKYALIPKYPACMSSLSLSFCPSPSQSLTLALSLTLLY